MSKAHDPHWRYIACGLAGQKASRKALGQAIRRTFGRLGWPDEDLPQLTRFEWPHAIVKVHHYRLAEVRDLMPTVDHTIEAATKAPLQVTTLSSSGTIKTLTDRLGVLAVRGEPGHRPGRR